MKLPRNGRFSTSAFRSPSRAVYPAPFIRADETGAGINVAVIEVWVKDGKERDSQCDYYREVGILAVRVIVDISRSY